MTLRRAALVALLGACGGDPDAGPNPALRGACEPAERVGRSSVVYRIGLFQGDREEAAAEGRFVHVYVDASGGPGNRPVVPLPDEIRAVVGPLLPR